MYEQPLSCGSHNSMKSFGAKVDYDFQYLNKTIHSRLSMKNETNEAYTPKTNIKREGFGSVIHTTANKEE